MVLPGLNWTADVDTVVGEQITEVDMASAGLTVIRLDGLLPPRTVEWLSSLPKSSVSIVIGKISTSKEHRQLAKQVTEGIRRRVTAMLEANGIGENDLLSVKRDAVFVVGREPRILTLPDGSFFRIKNTYNTFARLGRVELYSVPRRRTFDLKGVPKELRHLHADFTVRMVMDFLHEASRSRPGEAAALLQQFRRDYVARRLPVGFYRELNSDSCFAVRRGSDIFRFAGETCEVPVADLEIAHNIHNVIVPLARSIA